jgi:hypothetical protein
MGRLHERLLTGRIEEPPVGLRIPAAEIYDGYPGFGTDRLEPIEPRSAGMSASSADGADMNMTPPRPRPSVEELLAAKGTPVISSIHDLIVDTFESDAEVEEFVAFTRSERQREVS